VSNIGPQQIGEVAEPAAPLDEAAAAPAASPNAARAASPNAAAAAAAAAASTPPAANNDEQQLQQQKLPPKPQSERQQQISKLLGNYRYVCVPCPPQPSRGMHATPARFIAPCLPTQTNGTHPTTHTQNRGQEAAKQGPPQAERMAPAVGGAPSPHGRLGQLPAPSHPRAAAAAARRVVAGAAGCAEAPVPRVWGRSVARGALGAWRRRRASRDSTCCCLTEQHSRPHPQVRQGHRSQPMTPAHPPTRRSTPRSGPPSAPSPTPPATSKTPAGSCWPTSGGG